MMRVHSIIQCFAFVMLRNERWCFMRHRRHVQRTCGISLAATLDEAAQN